MPRIGSSRRSHSLAASGSFAATIGRNHDRTVTIRMNEIVRAHRHAGDAHRFTKAREMDERVRRADAAGQRLESRRPSRNVTDRSVGDDAETAERLVDRTVDLAPECAEADVRARRDPE